MAGAMQEGSAEHRRFERISTVKSLRVYTSLTNAAYTVSVTNISPKGAFIKTTHLPQKDEVITIQALNDHYSPIYTGQAQVRWIEKETSKDHWGFGVEFEDELPMDLVKKIH